MPNRGTEQRVDRLSIHIGSAFERLERRMNDAVASFRRRSVVLRYGQLADDRMHTAQLQVFALFGIPYESNHGMPATQQRFEYSRSDVPGCPGQKDAHREGDIVVAVGVESRQ